MDEQQDQNYFSSGMSTNNRDYQTTSIVQIRLDTKEILDKISVFLSAELLIQTTNEDGVVVIERESVGTPKCNKKGLQSINSFISSLVNSQVVQGNYDALTYRQTMFFVRNELTKSIIIGKHEWEIHDYDCETIIDFCMNLIEAFMSRLIDNKERESYASSVKVSENSVVNKNKKGLLSGFFGG